MRHADAAHRVVAAVGGAACPLNGHRVVVLRRQGAQLRAVRRPKRRRRRERVERVARVPGAARGGRHGLQRRRVALVRHERRALAQPQGRRHERHGARRAVRLGGRRVRHAAGEAGQHEHRAGGGKVARRRQQLIGKRNVRDAAAARVGRDERLERGHRAVKQRRGARGHLKEKWFGPHHHGT